PLGDLLLGCVDRQRVAPALEHPAPLPLDRALPSLSCAPFPSVLRTRKTSASVRADYDPLTAADRTATKAPLRGRRTGKRGHDLLSLLPALKCQVRIETSYYRGFQVRHLRVA